MTVVFGVDFEAVDGALAEALRGIDDARATVVPTNCGLAYDALLLPVESPADSAVAAALTHLAGTGAEVVALGEQSVELEALDAGAVDFVAWPLPGHTLAAQMGAAARRIRRVRQQRGDFERLRRLDDIRVRFLAANLSIDELLQLICDELLASEDLRAMTGADGAVIEMEEGDRLVYRAASGIMKTREGYSIPRLGSFSDHIMTTGDILYIADTETDPRVNRESTRLAGVRSAVGAPLIVDGRAVGVLKLASSSTEAFSAFDQRIVRGMGEMASAAMQREFERERMRDDLAEMARDRESLRQLAGTDPLTGLANRRQFAIAAEEALRRGAGRRPGVAVLALDLDQFKRVNDQFGHAAGDQVLVAVAGWLTTATREGDIIGRLGGEEFGIILPRVERDDAIATAERIRAAIEDGAVPFDGDWIRISVSIGVAPVSSATTVDIALRRADAALYRAKSSGRNRIVVADDDNVLPFPGATAK